MSDTRDVERLHEQLRAHHEKLATITPGSAERSRQVQIVLDATRDLLNGEAELAAAITEEKRRAGAHTIRIIAGVTGLALTAVAIDPIGGWVSRAWLLLLIPIALLSGLIWLSEPREPHTGQDQRRFAAILLAVTAAGAAVLTTTGLWPWCVIIDLVLAGGAALAWLTSTADIHPDSSPNAERQGI